MTIKVTGYQWYWGYEYPDNGIGEYVSNMLPPEKAKATGEPRLLGADNRLVLPVNTPIKLIITGADVIHSFSVPAFWVKEDAVPGPPQRADVHRRQGRRLLWRLLRALRRPARLHAHRRRSGEQGEVREVGPFAGWQDARRG